MTAINALDADIVALQEIENSVKLGEAPDEALADLVAGLNAAAGAGTWDYVRDARRAARCGDHRLHHERDHLQARRREAHRARRQTVVDETVWDIAREPIAQTFKLRQAVRDGRGEPLQVEESAPTRRRSPARTHSTTSGSRRRESLLAFANSLAEGRKVDVYLVGDFNSYAKEDPMKVFTDAGWSDVLFTKARGQYTYTFDGELGSLDHVIASPSAADKVTKAGVWSINSPEWAGREYSGPAAEAGQRRTARATTTRSWSASPRKARPARSTSTS